MNRSKLADYSEIISSIAIIITLIYLSIQTQQTNNALLANSRQATMAADVEMVSALISNPEAWANAMQTDIELSFVEQRQVINVLAGLLRIREFAWFQFKNGIMDEATFNSYLAPAVRWLRNIFNSWESLSADFDPEFVAHINKLLAEFPIKESATAEAPRR